MKTILFVDDDVTSLEVTKFLFEQEGYNCKSALNYEEAMSTLESEQVDLAIIDLRMPGIDGTELIKDIRKKYTFPVIAFTALDNFDVHEQVIQNGANCVITKPCSPNWLLQTVKELITNVEVK
ncbi:MAG: response regulator [Deltaproteobacteria bacterium]|nr:response regulator [Deltaproteobacteria bacterium]